MDNLRISGISKLKEQRAAAMRTVPTLDQPTVNNEFSTLSLDPIYQELKKIIHEFRQGDERENSLAYNQVLHNSLQKLVTEVEFTKPKELQHRFLEKVHSWYQDKLNSKSGSASSSRKFNTNSRLNTAASTRRTRNSSSQEYFINTTRSQLTERSVRSMAGNDCRDGNSSLSNVHNSNSVPNLSNILKNTSVNQATTKEIDQKVQIRIKTACTRGNNLINLHKSLSSKLRSWSLMKARRDEEFARKYESNKLTSKPDVRAYNFNSRSKSESKSRPETKHLDFRVNLKVRPATTDANKQERVDEIRQLFKLQVTTPDPDPDENLVDSAKNLNASQTSFSSREDTHNPELNTVFNVETLSSIKILNSTHTTLSSGRFSQLVELENIKKRLAKHSVTCSAITLHRALVTPDDIPFEKLRKDFPDHGKLISNPLFEKLYSRKVTHK